MKDAALEVREEVAEGDEVCFDGGVIDAMESCDGGDADDTGNDEGDADDAEGVVGDMSQQVGVGKGGKSGGKSGGKATTWDGYPAWAFKGGGKGKPGQVDRFGGVYVEGGYTYQGEFWEFGTYAMYVSSKYLTYSVQTCSHFTSQGMAKVASGSLLGYFCISASQRVASVVFCAMDACFVC